MKHIYIKGDITEKTYDDFMLSYSLCLQNNEDITVHIHSLGGSVMAGIGIFSTIKDSPLNITTVNEGVCASIAGIILLSGKNILCQEYSLFMLHSVSGEADDEVLSLFQNMIETIISGRTNISDMTLQMMMKKDSWFNATEQLMWGITDQIIGISKSKEDLQKETKQKLMNKVETIYNKVNLIMNENEKTLEMVEPILEEGKEISEETEVSNLENTTIEIEIDTNPMPEECVCDKCKKDSMDVYNSTSILDKVNKLENISNDLLDKINDLLDKINTKPSVLKSPIINVAKSVDKINNRNIRQLEKEDPKLLKEIYDNDIELYNKMYKEYYKS